MQGSEPPSSIPGLNLERAQLSPTALIIPPERNIEANKLNSAKPIQFPTPPQPQFLVLPASFRLKLEEAALEALLHLSIRELIYLLFSIEVEKYQKGHCLRMRRYLN